MGDIGKLGRPSAHSGERLIEGRLRTPSQGPELLSILIVWRRKWRVNSVQSTAAPLDFVTGFDSEVS